MKFSKFRIHKRCCRSIYSIDESSSDHQQGQGQRQNEEEATDAMRKSPKRNSNHSGRPPLPVSPDRSVQSNASSTMTVEENDWKKELLSMTPEIFLTRFRENGSECICRVYLMRHPVRDSISGVLSTSLPEDIFTLIDAQLSLLDDFLVSTRLLATEGGDAILVDGLLSILRNLWYKQTHFRNNFLFELESAVAASNDFLRMIEMLDSLMVEVTQKYDHLVWQEGKDDTTTTVLRREVADLISLFGSDAVFAAEKVSSFVMREVTRSRIPDELFGRDWEDRYVNNEVAVSIVQTYEEFLTDIHNWMGQEFLFHKVVVALVRSTVCFYLQCLVKKADGVRRNGIRRGFGGGAASSNAAPFMSTNRAMCRMSYDINVLRDYFYNVAKGNPALAKVVANELSVLIAVMECIGLAVGQTTADSLSEFIVVIHKRTGADTEVTRQFMSDIWLLTAPRDKQGIIEGAVTMMTSELDMVTARMKEKDAASPWKVNARPDLPSLRLDDMLKSMYEDRKLQNQGSICANILQDRSNQKRIKDHFSAEMDRPVILKNSLQEAIAPLKAMLASQGEQTRRLLNMHKRSEYGGRKLK